MSDEKFISIPYSIWNTKYKPLEQALKYSQEELETEKANKIHKLEIDIKKYYPDFYPRGYDTKRVVLGTFTVEIDKWSWNKKPSLSEMREVIKSLIEEANYHSGSEKLIMPSTKELDEMSNAFNKKERYILLKSTEIDNKINKLPKIVRWLFKIKKPQL